MLADIVRLIHIGLIVFMVVTPLVGGLPLLVLVESGYLLLFLHWIMNQDTCALTMLEQKLRGVDKASSFVHSVVAPFYGVSSTAMGRTVWVVSLVLFGVGLLRMWRLRLQTTSV